MKPTLDIATDAELRRVFSMEPEDDDPDDVIDVCDGQWRNDGDGIWRFWADGNCCERVARITGRPETGGSA